MTRNTLIVFIICGIIKLINNRLTTIFYHPGIKIAIKKFYCFNI